MIKNLIELDAAIEAMAELQGRAASKGELTGISKAWKRIKALPTVDAVPVVRCRECRWCNRGECEHKFGLLVSNDENYCSYGERDVDI